MEEGRVAGGRRVRFAGLGQGEVPLWWGGLSFVAGMSLAATAGRMEAGWTPWMVLAGMGWGLPLLLWWRSGTGLALWIGLFGAGGLCWLVEIESRGERSVRSLYERGLFDQEEPVLVEGWLGREPELAPDRIYLHLELGQVTSARQVFQVRGTVRLMIPFQDLAARQEYDVLGLTYGDRLRVWVHLRVRWGYRNPGAPNLEEMLEGRGIVATGTVKSPLLLEPLGAGPRHGWLAWLWSWRGESIRILLRKVEQPAAGLLVASLFGNRHFLSRRAAEAFRGGGTFHLLVISGVHVAMIALLVWRGLGWLIPGRSLRLGVGLGLIWGYAAMVGGEPPVIRAVLMITLHLVGRHLVRPLSGANSLGAALLWMLVWQPRQLFDPGFQISFFAVGVIVVGVVPLGDRLRAIGSWQPTSATPYPPSVPLLVRWGAELLFWEGARFEREMARERIRYRLVKAPLSTWLSRSPLQGLLRGVALALLTTTSIQIILLPLMVARFHRVSLLAPGINLLEAGLVSLLMVGGAAELGLQLILNPGAAERLVGLVPLLEMLGRGAVWVAETLVRWPGGSLRPPKIPAADPWLPLFYGGVVLVLLRLLHGWNPMGPRRRGQRQAGVAAMLATGGLLVAIVLSLVPFFPHARPRGRLSLTFLDVGQGDAILISFPQGHLVLLDSGGDLRAFRPRDGVEGQAAEGRDSFSDGTEGGAFEEDQAGIAEIALMPFLWHNGIHHLDQIAASHDHEDHVGGFTPLVRSFSVGEAWEGVFLSAIPETGQGTGYRSVVDRARIPRRRLRMGERFEIEGVGIEVLFVADPRQLRSANNQSMVLRLTYGSHRFLLPGDIEQEAERALLATGLDWSADVLKVAHHGSRTSSTAPFLDRVGACLAVISAASPSPFGHPHPEVLERLHRRGVRVYQTSTCGAITISTDGAALRVETTVPCHRSR
jgi:competence protein ComEC